MLSILCVVDRVVHLLDIHHLHQGDRDADIGRFCTAFFVPFNGRYVFVAAVFKDYEFAILFIRLVSAVGNLVAPLLHLDALPVVAGELVLFAACQLQKACIWFSFVALHIIVGDCPLVFAKKLGDFGGSRHGGHCRLNISHHPLAGCVVVLNSGGVLAPEDHVARVVRQLLWTMRMPQVL